MEMKIVKSSNEATLVALAGKLDVQGEEQIGNQFRKLMEDSRAHVMLDMSGVTYLASLGIRLLFSGAKTLASVGKKIVVVNPQTMVEDTLLNSGTVKLIPIAKDEREALDMLRV